MEIQEVSFLMKREPGLDLLRCVALLCVITFHGFLYNGYYREPQAGGAMLLAGSVRWLSVSCVGLFLMLAGYLKSGRTELRACYRGLPSVLLGYLLAAAVSIPVRHFFLGDPQPLFIWVRRLLGFRGVYYGWYVEMYVGLMLLSPFVNRGLMAQPSRGGLLALGAVLLAVTALPGATPLELAPAYWRSMYPLTYYVLGALVRRFQPEIPPLGGPGRSAPHGPWPGGGHGAVHRGRPERGLYPGVRRPVDCGFGGVPVRGPLPGASGRAPGAAALLGGRGLFRRVSPVPPSGRLVLPADTGVENPGAIPPVVPDGHRSHFPLLHSGGQAPGAGV